MRIAAILLAAMPFQASADGHCAGVQMIAGANATLPLQMVATISAMRDGAESLRGIGDETGEFAAAFIEGNADLLEEQVFLMLEAVNDGVAQAAAGC